MRLIRLPGFLDKDVPPSLLKQIRNCKPMFSMGQQEMDSFVEKKVLNAILVGFQRGQSSTRINILVDHTVMAIDQSGAEAMALESCSKVEDRVRKLGFRVSHGLEFRKDRKGRVITASNGRVIKILHVKVENLQHACIDCINKVRELWRELNDSTPIEQKRPAFKKKAM